MHSVVSTNDAESSDRKGLANAYARQREIGTTARGATALSTAAERDAAFAAFLRHDVVQLDVYQRWGVTFATTLHRGGAKGFTLHLDSDSLDIPNEHHDLNQGEVDIWLAECEGGPAPEIVDWPIVRPEAPLDRALYTPAALAKRWECSAGLVTYLIATGELPGFKLGMRKRRVHADQVAEFERRPAVMTKEYAKAVATMEIPPTADALPTIVHPLMSYQLRAVYSPQQLAERWGCSSESVRQAIKAGQLDGFRHGKRLLRVRAEAVHAYEVKRLPEAKSAEERAEQDAIDKAQKEAMHLA